MSFWYGVLKSERGGSVAPRTKIPRFARNDKIFRDIDYFLPR
jgi:hypothetical protein